MNLASSFKSVLKPKRDDWEIQPDAVTQMATLLIESGAKVDATDADGLTLLSLACRTGQVALVYSLLFKHSADPLVDDVCGRTPLHAAAAGGFGRIVEMLLDRSSVIDYSDHEGVTPLMLACKGGFFDVAQILIRKGANVKSKDHQGKTPLHYCAMSGSLEIATLLVDQGASVNAADVSGTTPHSTALAHNETEVASYLSIYLSSQTEAEDDAGVVGEDGDLRANESENSSKDKKCVIS